VGGRRGGQGRAEGLRLPRLRRPRATLGGVKCGANRDEADEWLRRFPADAAASAYIGRSGWNSLTTGGAIPDDEILEAIDTSYALVVSKLPKKDRPAAS
jgi:predicted DNA-binding protein (MmcQ/YjbR family)